MDTVQDTLDLFMQKMLNEKVFNCTMCSNILNTPVTLVENIGNVCSDCYQKNSYIGYHNERFDVLLNELKFPCKFHMNGCQEKVDFKDLKFHQENCHFYTRKCLLHFLQCKWEGIQSDIPKHFFECHPSNVLTGTDNMFCLDLDLNDAKKMVNLIRTNKYCFALQIDQTLDEKCLIYTMWEVADRLSEFKCLIRHKGNGSNFVETELAPNDSSSMLKAQVFKSPLQQMLETEYLVKIEIMISNKNEANSMDSKFLKFFECPICTILMKPPIYQCKNGHSFCNMCKQKMETCPTCRGNFGNTRNYSLEALTGEIPYRCSNYPFGCDEILLSNEMDKHEAVCCYKRFPCPIQHCSVLSNNFNIFEHINNTHQDQVHFSNSLTTKRDFKIDSQLNSYNTFEKHFLVFDNNIFRLSLKQNSDYCFWAVETLRRNDESSVFIYDIGIIDERRPERKLIRTDLCLNEISVDDLFKKCILFPRTILSSYAYNGTYTYYCQITTKN